MNRDVIFTGWTEIRTSSARGGIFDDECYAYAYGTVGNQQKSLAWGARGGGVFWIGRVGPVIDDHVQLFARERWHEGDFVLVGYEEGHDGLPKSI